MTTWQPAPQLVDLLLAHQLRRNELGRGPAYLIRTWLPTYLLECSNVWSWLTVGVRSVGVTIRGRIRSFGPGSPTSWRVGSIWLDCAGLTDSPAHTAAAVAAGGRAQGCGCAPIVG
jgi:hypothetical protein